MVKNNRKSFFICKLMIIFVLQYKILKLWLR